jgi:hypothetical protein
MSAFGPGLKNNRNAFCCSDSARGGLEGAATYSRSAPSKRPSDKQHGWAAFGLKRHKGLEPLMGAIGPPYPFFALIVLIDSNHLKKHEIDDGTAAAIRRIERARRRPERVQLGAPMGYPRC